MNTILLSIKVCIIWLKLYCKSLKKGCLYRLSVYLKNNQNYTTLLYYTDKCVHNWRLRQLKFNDAEGT